MNVKCPLSLHMHQPMMQMKRLKRDSTANSILIPRHDILLIIGDLDARVSNNNKETEITMGKHALGKCTDNG